MNLNKVIILGRMTADPQLRTTPGGQSVTSFGVATNRLWKDKGGNRQEETEFHAVVVWGRQAEIATKFLQKGGLVLIEGRLRTRSWQDKQGQTRKTTEIIADQIQLGPRPMGASPMGGRSDADASPAPAKSVEEEIPTIDIEEEMKAEDIPF